MSATQEHPRPAWIHPEHPGLGCSTSLKRLEGTEPEVGGVIIFFPSGLFHDISWRAVQHITPTKEAAVRFVGQIVEDLNKKAAKAEGPAREAIEQDLARTNWVSVTAAVQRVIMDWNDKLSSAISAKMAQQFGGNPWPPKHRTH